MYSFGSASLPSDRALGSLASNSVQPQFGVCFINNTGSPITSIVVAFTGEQWRHQDSTSDSLDFQYVVSESTPLSAVTGWIAEHSLDFGAPKVAATSAVSLDGNAIGNRTAKSYTINGLSIPPLGKFWVKWVDLNVGGSDQALGIDDFSLTPQGTPTSADIKVNSFSFNPTTAYANGATDLTLDIGNVGPSTATNVVATIPDAPTFLTRGVLPSGCVFTSPNIVCTTASIASGATMQYVIPFTVVAAPPGDTVALDVTLTSSTADPTPGNETGSASLTITYCGDGKLQSGNSEICDDGGSTSGNGCSASCQREKNYKCTGSEGGLSTCVPVTADLGLTTFAFNPVSGYEGNSTTFNFTVINGGPDNVDEARVFIVFDNPSALNLVAPNGCSLENGTFTCLVAVASGSSVNFSTVLGIGLHSLGNPADALGEVTFPTAIGTDTNNLNNDAEATFLVRYCGDSIRQDDADPVSAAQEACDNGGVGGDGCSSSCVVELGWSCSGDDGQPSVCTNNSADLEVLSVGFQGGQTSANSGSTVTVEVHIFNNGAVEATGVVTTITLPPELTLVGAPPLGCVDNVGVISCTLPSLVAGAVIAPWLIPVTVGAPVGNPVTVTASVSGQQADSVPSNNSDSLIFNINAYDYGDAGHPDTGVEAYGTTADCRHQIDATGPILGATVDAEAAGSPTLACDGEGADDDGFTGATVFNVGQPHPLFLTLSGNLSAFQVEVYIDFNRDGVFATPDELFGSADQAGLVSGSQVVVIGTTPADATLGLTAMRLRIARTLAGIGPTGSAADGEVEDYQVSVTRECGDITVNSLGSATDPSDNLCTLPEAVIAANTNAVSGPGATECNCGKPWTGTQPDQIYFDEALFPITAAYTIDASSLVSGLALTEAVAIHGVANYRLTVVGKHNTPVFTVQVPTAQSVAINHLDLRGSADAGFAGDGYALTLTSGTTVLSGVTASGGVGVGRGAWYVAPGATLHAMVSAVLGNSVLLPDDDQSQSTLGGGLYCGGTCTLASCTIRGKRAVQGGAIYVPAGGVLNAIDGFFDDNRAHGTVGGGPGGNASGGALYCGGTCNLTRARLTGNRAGDPNVDLVTAPAVGIDAFGGAVYVALDGQFSALNSFFRDSVANGGLGFTTSGRAMGGAIYSADVDAHCDFCTVINSSVRDATPPAAVPSSSASLDFVAVRNSIIAFSTINDDPTDVTCATGSGGASFESLGGNLYTTEAVKLVCGNVTTDSFGEIGVDDHRYLSATSAALSAAQDCKTWAGTTVTDDILNIDRPYGPKCESGAKEMLPTEIELTLSGPASVLTPTTAGATLDLSTTLKVNGDDGAGVSVTYDLPSGVTFASATGMTCTGSSTLVCYVGVVYYVAPPGAPTTVGLKLNVAQRTTAVTITATSYAENGDSDDTNDSGSVTVQVRYCGDGTKEDTEGCDDGDNDPGDGCSASCVVESGWECSGTPSQCVGYDYGDAPASYDVGNPARHAVNWLYLGAALPDVEAAPQSTPEADGDGADDDGVQMPASLVRGDNPATFTLGKGAGAPLSELVCITAWVDMQQDNAFDPIADRVYIVDTGADALPLAINDIPITIPAGAKSGPTFLRARLMRGDCSDPTPTGLEDAGEVEDYRITIANTCGDGNKEGTEGCDDGDLDGDDGCSALCAVEAGWECSGTVPSLCVRAVDLSVTVSVVDNVLEVGQDIAATVTVNNLAPTGATGVKVKALLPPGVGFSSADPSVGSYNAGTGIWTIGVVGAGGSVSLVLHALVAADQVGKSLTLAANIEEVVPNDDVPENNSASVQLHTPYAFSASGASIDFGGFAGSGFTMFSGAGQLSSLNWALTGYGPELVFGGTSTDPTLARGVSSGVAGAAGGIYAAETASGNRALGIKPDDAVGTPGMITLRLENISGETLERARVSYRLSHFNDGPVRNQVDFSYSTDGLTFTMRSEKFWQTEADAAVSPEWIGSDRVGVLDGLALPDGGFLYLRWTTDQNFGTGTDEHDEIALDDIVVTRLDAAAADPIYYTEFSGGTALVPFGIIRADGVKEPIGGGLDFGFDNNRSIKLIPSPRGNFVAYNVGGSSRNSWGIVNPATGVFTSRGDLVDEFEMTLGEAPVMGLSAGGDLFAFGFIGSSQYKFGRFDVDTGAFTEILNPAPNDFATSFAPAPGGGLYYVQQTGGTAPVPFGIVDKTTGVRTPIGDGLDFLTDSNREVQLVTSPSGALFGFDLPSGGGGGTRNWGTIDTTNGVFTPIGDMAAEFDMGFIDLTALAFTASGKLLVHGFIGSSTYKLGELSTSTGAFTPIELPAAHDYAYSFGTPPVINCGNIDDNNPCTDDACDPSTGVITRTNNTNTCDDATMCNGREVCGGGTCNAGTPVSCIADANICTTEACVPATGLCASSNVPNGNVATDTDLCNGQQSCNNGVLSEGTAPAPCTADTNICTTEACVPATGLCASSNVPNGDVATDTDLCNGQQSCSNGVLSEGTAPAPCTADTNICTTEACVPATGLCASSNVPNGNVATDTDLCNGQQSCNGVLSEGTAPAPCTADTNICTTEACVPATGLCASSNVPNGDATDTDLCNGQQSCSNGVLSEGTAPAPCTADTNIRTTEACVPATGLLREQQRAQRRRRHRHRSLQRTAVVQQRRAQRGHRARALHRRREHLHDRSLRARDRPLREQQRAQRQRRHRHRSLQRTAVVQQRRAQRGHRARALHRRREHLHDRSLRARDRPLREQQRAQRQRRHRHRSLQRTAVVQQRRAQRGHRARALHRRHEHLHDRSLRARDRPLREQQRAQRQRRHRHRSLQRTAVVQQRRAQRRHRARALHRRREHLHDRSLRARDRPLREQQRAQRQRRHRHRSLQRTAVVQQRRAQRGHRARALHRRHEHLHDRSLRARDRPLREQQRAQRQRRHRHRSLQRTAVVQQRRAQRRHRARALHRRREHLHDRSLRARDRPLREQQRAQRQRRHRHRSLQRTAVVQQRRAQRRHRARALHRRHEHLHDRSLRARDRPLREQQRAQRQRRHRHRSLQRTAVVQQRRAQRGHRARALHRRREHLHDRSLRARDRPLREQQRAQRRRRHRHRSLQRTAVVQQRRAQ